MIRASAPGKLMLTGEYTVLEPEGMALAVAVDRRLTLTLEGGGARWRVSSDQLGLDEADLDAVPVLAAALNALPELADRPGHIRVTSELATTNGRKLGLGSSAALSVTALGALHRYTGRPVPMLGEVIAVHRAAQGGRGSGYDVAACLLGGVTLFERQGGNYQARRVDWPEGLAAGVMFCGHSASTVALIERVDCWESEDPEDMEAFLEPLRSETRELIAAWLAGDVSRILTAAAQVQEELDAFDRAGEIGIYAGGQMQLLAAVEDAGAIGRTSGAGGGDCIWALAGSEAVIDAATARARAMGFERVALGFPAEGLRVEED